MQVELVQYSPGGQQVHRFTGIDVLHLHNLSLDCGLRRRMHCSSSHINVSALDTQQNRLLIQIYNHSCASATFGSST
jgi:hypothetical protein